VTSRGTSIDCHAGRRTEFSWRRRSWLFVSNPEKAALYSQESVSGEAGILVIPFTVNSHGGPRRAASRGISLYLRLHRTQIPRFARNNKIKPLLPPSEECRSHLTNRS
jgi:hypothetical protein